MEDYTCVLYYLHVSEDLAHLFHCPLATACWFITLSMVISGTSDTGLIVESFVQLGKSFFMKLLL